MVPWQFGSAWDLLGEADVTMPDPTQEAHPLPSQFYGDAWRFGDLFADPLRDQPWQEWFVLRGREVRAD